MAATTEYAVAAPVRPHSEAHPTGKRLLILSFTALGVVYGDIGTSPLYALKECFKPVYGLAVTTGAETSAGLAIVAKKSARMASRSKCVHRVMRRGLFALGT